MKTGTRKIVTILKVSPLFFLPIFSACVKKPHRSGVSAIESVNGSGVGLIPVRAFNVVSGKEGSGEALAKQNMIRLNFGLVSCNSISEISQLEQM